MTMLQTICMFHNSTELFQVGDRVRVLHVGRCKEQIGEIKRIYLDRFVIFIGGIIQEEFTWKFDEVFKIRHNPPNVDMNDEQYFDDEEREFWRTHWHTRDGIKEKTPEDIKMLEEFERKWKEIM